MRVHFFYNYCSSQNLFWDKTSLPKNIVFWTVHEPLTCFCIPGVTIPGGDKRTRTADICLARAALYQLSYTPFPGFSTVVGYAGFEPATSPLSGVRSNQLS